MKVITSLIIVFLLMAMVSATTVNLTADKSEVILGKLIKFHLKIQPTNPVGGTFSINKEIAYKTFKLERVLFDKSSCFTCGGGALLSEDIDRVFSFRPKTIGNYYAEANFGGNRNKVEFKVSVSTTTTSRSTVVTTTLPEKYCATDSDCACGVHITTRDCFYGNKRYADSSMHCPDFCNGLAGNLEIRCIDTECHQVTLTTITTPLRSPAVTTTTLLSQQETTCSTCQQNIGAKIFLMMVFIIVLISFIIIPFFRQWGNSKKNEKN